MKILDTGEIIYKNQNEKQIICTDTSCGIPTAIVPTKE